MDNRMDRAANGAKGVRGMWRAILWGGLALVLVIPALAMQFTSEVNWDSLDFVVMGITLGILGLGIELVMRRLRDWPARLAASTAVLLVCLAIWVELSVGVFGTPFAGS